MCLTKSVNLEGPVYKDIQTLHICIEMKPRHNVFVNTCQNKGHNLFLTGIDTLKSYWGVR